MTHLLAKGLQPLISCQSQQIFKSDPTISTTFDLKWI